jgi:hypothetical protein
MRKFIFGLILISLSCMASEPKFHFRDCVKVTKGFYRGCVGAVENYNGKNRDGENTYGVGSNDCNGEQFYEFFKESDLKLLPIKGCQ